MRRDRYRRGSYRIRGTRTVIPRLALAFLFAATPAVAADPTGVPQCDALLKRYEACSGQMPPRQVHAAQKELLEGRWAFGQRR